MSIGTIIREKRMNKGLTQVQLGEQIGVTTSMVNQIERGTKMPTLPLAKEIADVLQCKVEDFLV